MEKNIGLAANSMVNKQTELADLAKSALEWASVPVRLLAKYYSAVLEREVTTKQAWHLIEVQSAFFAGIFPADLSATFRLLAIFWFVSALLRCKKAL